MANDIENVMIEGATLIYRNFSGKESQYNREGDRNFGVILPEEVAADLIPLGWNVRRLKPRDLDEEGVEPAPYISVAVSYKIKPPRIVMITSKARTNLDEERVGVLDWAEIKTADLIFRPYEWTARGESGVKAYLQSLFVTIDEDPLELKYAVESGV